MNSAIEPISAVDRAWLEMDQPRNPMVVSAVIELSGRGGAKALAKLIMQRLLACPRFRQRADVQRDPAAWIEDGELDLGYHVHILRVPAGGPEALRALIAGELSVELDRERPLWRLTLLTRGRGHITVLFRAHHAMADGIALMQLLLATSDRASAEPPQVSDAQRVQHGPLGPLIGRLESANRLLERASSMAAEELRDPSRLLRHVAEGSDMVSALARVLKLGDTRPTVLRQQLSGHRRVAWATSMSLAQMRGVAQRHDVSVNDVFVAILTGAFRRWLAWQNALLISGQSLRISIPVNLRAAGDTHLGNCFGLVLLDLPISLADTSARLQECASRMRALKQSGEARAVLAGLAVAGHLPVTIEKRLIHLVAGKAAAVVSNLPGPEQPLHMGGMTIDSVVFWPPQAGDIGIGISLLSYAGQVTVGVSADRGVVRDPQALIDAFQAEAGDIAGSRRRSEAKRMAHAG